MNMNPIEFDMVCGSRLRPGRSQYRWHPRIGLSLALPIHRRLPQAAHLAAMRMAIR